MLEAYTCLFLEFLWGEGVFMVVVVVVLRVVGVVGVVRIVGVVEKVSSSRSHPGVIS